ncbi:MAG: nucleotidyl transferase AbiEii/AbiGii toxin family protein [Dehalococcoidales bacterium]|nr:nucleotidyl transferase AbiEii/AbiGii toxin family protein [Dehalococcoidales bacterium]
MRLRKLVAFERMLARLVAAAPDRWVLKGALAFHFRLAARFRTTKDMDLGRWDNERAATDDLIAAQQVDLGDHFRFAVEKTARLDQLLEGAAVRYHVSAYLAGRRFEELTVDVGFGDPPLGEPERLRGPDLLSFAEIAPIEVPALPLEQHVAEKVHAYTRSYAGGHSSTRTKDLIDLALISSLFPFQAGRLRGAFRATFDARGTHPLPTTLRPPPAGWGPAYRRAAAEVGLEPDVSIGYQQAAVFLDPILGGAVSDASQWDPIRRSW